MFKRGKIKTIIKPLFYISVFLVAIFFFSKNAMAEESPHLLINEIYPCPKTGETEWVELYNPTEDNVELKDYLLASKYGSLPEQIFNFSDAASDITIKPKSFFVLAEDEAKFFDVYNIKPDLKLDNITLANSADYLVLRLKSESDETDIDTDIDSVSWGESYKDIVPFDKTIKTSHSIERQPLGTDTDDCSKDFVDRETSTPGAEYVDTISVVDADKTLTIEDAREMENSEDVVVTGTVTTLPGVLSSQYFYIQDETGGMQVYSYGKAFPALVLGDIISVTGELSETNNERRIKISSADKVIILNHTNPVAPAEIAISNIGEQNEGTYVKTAGIVTQTNGDQFYISDGQSEIKVVINKTTGIDKPKMKKGDQVEVSGIVSQYKDEYRILPIDQDDVKIVASEDLLPRAGADEFIYLIISFLITLIWNIFLKAKKRHLKLRTI